MCVNLTKQNSSQLQERFLPLSLLVLPVLSFLMFLNWSLLTVNAQDNEYFTSVVGMENLLKAEVALVTDLQQYIDGIQKHIDNLQREVNVIRADHLNASEDVEGFINNPVNAYRLIKRLHSDWDTIEDSIRSDTTSDNFLTAMDANELTFGFPTREDVVGAAMALARLLDTYQLDVADMASGILNGIKYGPSMSLQDCFQVGSYLYDIRDYNHTVPWLKQTVQMLKDEPDEEDPSTLDFLQTVSSYFRRMGDFATALELINYVLELDATRASSLQNTISYLNRMINKGVKEGPLYESKSPNYHNTEDFKRYEKVCRGDLKLSPSQERPLRCRYFTNNAPFHLLQPFKLEERYLDPYVVVVHDMITAPQAETLKNLSMGRMTRSMVRNFMGTAGIGVDYRISKSSYFSFREHSHTLSMQRQFGALTGLSMQQTDRLQVANYGMGGHFEPHYDFFTDNKTITPSQGNRLASGLYYLSDVEEGGFTIFPHLHVRVKPELGSVLFWYNLHPSEDFDFRSKHAACPVLKGSKWIANVWVHVRGQEFTRPCGLTRRNKVSLKFERFIKRQLFKSARVHGITFDETN